MNSKGKIEQSPKSFWIICPENQRGTITTNQKKHNHNDDDYYDYYCYYYNNYIYIPVDGNARLTCGVLATLINCPPAVANNCICPMAVAAAPTGTGTEISCWMPPAALETLVPAETGMSSCCSGNVLEPGWVPAASTICGTVDWPSTDGEELLPRTAGEKTPENDDTKTCDNQPRHFATNMSFIYSIYLNQTTWQIQTNRDRQDT